VGADEDDVEGHEPLPDPTMRTWRHPSELAAVAAMAARTNEPPPSRPRLSGWSVAVGAALGAAAVLGVVTVSALVGSGGAGGGPDRAIAWASTTVATTTSTTAPTTTAPAADPEPEPTAAPTTTAPPPTTTPVPIGGELAASELPVVPTEAVIGVQVDPHAAAPDCTAVVVDGMIVTSASALGTVEHVTLVIAGAHHPGRVLGRDRYTDVAVIAVPDGVVPTELAAGEPPEADAAVALLATDGRPEPIALIGRVTAPQATSQAADGHPLIGLLATTARRPETGAGALLLNPQGELVGMVVTGRDHLASALPRPTVAEVARSLTLTGHPSAVWIGISARSSDDGRVQLTAVTPRGPAHDAGLRPGDVLLGADGSPVDDLAGFISLLRTHEPGDAVTIAAERQGEPLEVEVVLSGPRPPSTSRLPEQAAAEG
jgi:putative serine protease PepD